MVEMSRDRLNRLNMTSSLRFNSEKMDKTGNDKITFTKSVTAHLKDQELYYPFSGLYTYQLEATVTISIYLFANKSANSSKNYQHRPKHHLKLKQKAFSVYPKNTSEVSQITETRLKIQY